MLAGVAAVAGLGLLFGGFAVGRMAVVAPVSAAVGGVVPIAWGLANGDAPVRWRCSAVVTLSAAVVLARSEGRRRTPLEEATTAGRADGGGPGLPSASSSSACPRPASGRPLATDDRPFHGHPDPDHRPGHRPRALVRLSPLGGRWWPAGSSTPRRWPCSCSPCARTSCPGGAGRQPLPGGTVLWPPSCWASASGRAGRGVGRGDGRLVLLSVAEGPVRPATTSSANWFSASILSCRGWVSGRAGRRPEPDDGVGDPRSSRRWPRRRSRRRS